MRLHPDDTVACLLRDHRAGEIPALADGPGPRLRTDVAMGHKIALAGIDAGNNVIKYGAPIGTATAEIAPGDHVHLHNLQGRIR